MEKSPGLIRLEAEVELASIGADWMGRNRWVKNDRLEKILSMESPDDVDYLRIKRVIKEIEPATFDLKIVSADGGVEDNIVFRAVRKGSHMWCDKSTMTVCEIVSALLERWRGFDPPYGSTVIAKGYFRTFEFKIDSDLPDGVAVRFEDRTSRGEVRAFGHLNYRGEYQYDDVCLRRLDLYPY